MKKVSVIIPVYNCEKHIGKCLNSILNQTLKDIEIIVVNDCSTDHSEKIILDYEKNYQDKIKLISNKENCKAGKSRNLGLEIAEGKYISFIDADDFIDLNMLEKMYNRMEETDAEISRVNRKMVLKNIDVSFLGRNAKMNEEKIINPFSEAKYLITEYPCCTNKMFSQELIKENRFVENLKWEDYPFTIPLLTKTNKIATIPDSYYYYTINIKGTTCGDIFSIKENILDIFECSDIVYKNSISETTPNLVKEQVEFIRIQNCLQRLRDILYSSISKEKKIELISMISELINKKYGNWQENKLYLSYKDDHKIYKKRMDFIEKYYIKDTYKALEKEELEEEIKYKIKKMN